MTEELAESKIAEAANAAAVAHEANASAREAQIYESVIKAFNHVLTAGDDGSAPILIKRIPFICLDIAWIKKLLWTLLGANGAVLLALIGVAIQRAFA